MVDPSSTDAAPKPADSDGSAFDHPFWSFGFRPFFFGAGLWAVASMVLWNGVWTMGWAVPSAFDPLAWHVHEMLYGYAGAALAGFLLTAIPNWTGRLPVRGASLAGLFALWILGRIACAISEPISVTLAAVIDLLFWCALTAVVLREIVAGANWRNMPMLIALATLTAGNALMHLDAGGLATGGIGDRLGLATMLLLIALVGGRVVPSFTRNWLAKRGAKRMPSPHDLFDRLCLAVAALALLVWVILPEGPWTGAVVLAAGVLHAARLARWRGERTLVEPLLFMLHVGYAWLAVGLILLGAAELVTWLPPSAALHALTAGAVGAMTIAIMTRASLGHSARALTAGPWTQIIFALITLAALIRVLGPIMGKTSPETVALAAVLWAAGFLGFVIRYAPIWFRRSS